MHKYDCLQQEFDNVFQPKKLSSLKYADVLVALGETKKRASRVKECGSYLEFGLYDDESVKLHRANFCGDVLCPQCAKRKSLKIYSQVSACVDRMKDYQFLFCTLTIKNCIADDLSATCDLLYDAYTRLIDRKRMSFVRGAFRALEITVNRSKDIITYHPHLHCIFAVNTNYFQSADYLSQKSLAEYWGYALGVDYTPIVDIRTCKDKGLTTKGGKSIFKSINSAVAEVAKYAVKSTDYLSGSDEQNKEVVKTLLSALRNRKMFAFTGVFRTVRKELKLDEVEGGDLVHIEAENQVDSASLVAKLYFVWDKKNKEYVHIGVKMIDEEQTESS